MSKHLSVTSVGRSLEGEASDVLPFLLPPQDETVLLPGRMETQGSSDFLRLGEPPLSFVFSVNQTLRE